MIRRAFVTLALALACVFPLSGQSRGWTAFWENDSFSSASTDVNYTNGLRVSWYTAREGTTRLLLPGRPAGFTSGWSVGQHQFTPQELTVFDLDLADRPYSGFLYGGRFAEYINVLDHRRVATLGTRIPVWWNVRTSDLVELDLGFVGKAAFPGTAQAGVHVLKARRMPKGWTSLGRTELAGNLSWLGRADLRLIVAGDHPGEGFHLSVVPQLGGTLGTVQTYGTVGVGASVGWGMDEFMPLTIQQTLAASLYPEVRAQAEARKRTGRQNAVPTSEEEGSHLGVSLFYSRERRFMARNYYLDGSLWSDGRAVDREDYVSDRRWGVSLRGDPWRLTWVQTKRSPELAGGPYRGEHEFGSVILSRAGGRSVPGAGLSWLLDHIAIEAGLGSGVTELESDARARKVKAGPSMHAAVLFWPRDPHFSIALEMTGVGRPTQDPPEILDTGEERYVDAFLRTRAITLRIRPFERPRFFGLPEVAIGPAEGRIKRQELVATSSTETVNDLAQNQSLGIVFGLRDYLRISPQMLVGLGVQGALIPEGSAALGTGRYVSGTLVLRWAPRPFG